MNRLPSERHPNKRAGESFDWAAMDVPDDTMGDTRITDWAMRQLDQKHSKPFFLGVGYYRPHIPLFAPKRDFDHYPPVEAIQLPKVMAGDLDDLGSTARSWALEPITAGSHQIVERSGQWKEAVRAYLACVTFVDRQLGRLLDQLEASPHADNTWIILWGDHGWHLGEKQHWGKWTGWRESTRVPLMVIPPERESQAARGKRCDAPVSLLDLYPTLVEICGLAAREDLSGKSLMPWIRNPERQTRRSVMTFFDPGNVAISDRHWRYIRYANGEEELYHLPSDPQEWTNLATSIKHTEVIRKFRTQLEQLNVPR